MSFNEKHTVQKFESDSHTSGQAEIGGLNLLYPCKEFPGLGFTDGSAGEEAALQARNVRGLEGTL